VPVDVFACLTVDADSIWLCADCLPNLIKYLPGSVSTAATTVDSTALSSAAVDKIEDMCGRTNAVLTSCHQSFAQHCDNIRLLELKMSEAIKSVEKLNVSLTTPQQTSPLPSAASSTSDRNTNVDRLIITNLPILQESRLIESVVALAHRFEMDLRVGDIASCNQQRKAHPSNASPVFLKFVSQCTRNEFYSRYLHYAKCQHLGVADVLPDYRGNTRRIYVSEHLTPSDNIIFREARRMRSKGQIASAFTRRGAVYIIPLGTDCPKLIGALADLPIGNVHQFTPTRTSIETNVNV
jgi:hypothetical protein